MTCDEAEPRTEITLLILDKADSQASAALSHLSAVLSVLVAMFGK